MKTTKDDQLLQHLSYLKLPFFRDNYRRINVREYARIRKISPPSASELLNRLKKEDLLVREKERNYIYYSADKESKMFIELSRVYWGMQLKGLIEHIEKQLINPLIILFGSFSKAEVKHDSDIDLAIFSVSNKKISLGRFEKLLKRKLQLFMFKSRKEIKNKELFNNILNGYIISGSW